MPDAVKTPQQVHGGIPVQPWFERAFAQQGVDDVPGAGGAARFGPSSISEHLIERLEASAKLRVRLSGWAAARGSSRGSWRSRGPGACQILNKEHLWYACTTGANGESCRACLWRQRVRSPVRFVVKGRQIGRA